MNDYRKWAQRKSNEFLQAFFEAHSAKHATQALRGTPPPAYLSHRGNELSAKFRAVIYELGRRTNK